MLSKISLRETSRLSEAEILLRNLPLDNPVANLALISEKMHSGKARVYEIKKNNERVGVAVFEVFKREFWVLAMIASKQVDIFTTAQEIIPQLARNNNCTEIVYWTLRPGLIQKALKDGAYISHVELRKKL